MRRQLLTFVLAAAACGVLSPEEQQLRRFFEASRLHDTTAAARLSSVAFNPRSDGIVDGFQIREITREGEVTRLVVLADVRRPDGRTIPTMLRVTLQHQADGRWRIVALTAQ